MAETSMEPRGSDASRQLVSGLKVQIRVIGALILRELHTRFGRNNIGYLWLILEPMILSFGVSLIHVFNHISLPYGFDPGTFYASGYITYIVFRNNVNRSTSLIEANKPLLYHRMVTVTDISIARALLEGLATLGAMAVMAVTFTLIGLSELPQRPWLILLAVALMTWLAAGVGMIITAATEMSPIVERFVHPATYLIMPFTGMFYVLDQLPKPYADLISWIPLPQISDLARMGFRTEFQSSYFDLVYLILVCACTTLLGLLALRVARRGIHFE